MFSTALAIPDVTRLPAEFDLTSPPSEVLSEVVPSPSATSPDGAPVYEVEKILDWRLIGNLLHYYIKVNGYSIREWTEEENVFADDIVFAYEKAHPSGADGKSLTKVQLTRAKNERLERRRKAYFEQPVGERVLLTKARPPRRPTSFKKKANRAIRQAQKAPLFEEEEEDVMEF
ncbi:hypothetical protein M427DRAFT_50007 [Gonapodya prolifera JEL478]|uniref:Chromo domain-containing protein n=1 Tax=Gonapodya prolifera (strain JEL478) TaxID=1344416 RepID=A0A138ZXC5_GONPJ|nr:hypothetical protein M427DRAFT_50007 [Gonapodya prolifera JEL478]|eukprot:KXS09101.1 hypothetical protein M427DRAFT_50007 [Gonapodya prolifera JEL478]